MKKEGTTKIASMTGDNRIEIIDNRIEIIDGIVLSSKGLQLFTRYLQQFIPSKDEKTRRSLPKKRRKFNYMEHSESEEDVDDSLGGEEEEEAEAALVEKMLL